MKRIEFNKIDDDDALSATYHNAGSLKSTTTTGSSSQYVSAESVNEALVSMTNKFYHKNRDKFINNNRSSRAVLFKPPLTNYRDYEHDPAAVNSQVFRDIDVFSKKQLSFLNTRFPTNQQPKYKITYSKDLFVTENKRLSRLIKLKNLKNRNNLMDGCTLDASDAEPEDDVDDDAVDDDDDEEYGKVDKLYKNLDMSEQVAEQFFRQNQRVKLEKDLRNLMHAKAVANGKKSAKLSEKIDRTRQSTRKAGPPVEAKTEKSNDTYEETYSTLLPIDSSSAQLNRTEFRNRQVLPDRLKFTFNKMNSSMEVFNRPIYVANINEITKTTKQDRPSGRNVKSAFVRAANVPLLFADKLSSISSMSSSKTNPNLGRRISANEPSSFDCNYQQLIRRSKLIEPKLSTPKAKYWTNCT